MDSGVTHNVTDNEAITPTGSASEAAKVSRENEKPAEGDATSVKENGKVVGSGRPPLETFVTAADELPTASTAHK